MKTNGNTQAIVVNNKQRAIATAKTVLTIVGLLAWNATMSAQAGGIAGAFTAVSGVCKSLILPAFMLVGLAIAVVGILKGIRQMQEEENGLRTILTTVIFGVLIGGGPAAAGTLITIPGTTGPFCQ